MLIVTHIHIHVSEILLHTSFGNLNFSVLHMQNSQVSAINRLYSKLL